MERVFCAKSAPMSKRGLRSLRNGFSFARLDLPFPTQELAPLYRFALLLTASQTAAEQIVVSSFKECAAHLDSYRTPASRTACLLNKIREHCLKKPSAAAASADLAAQPPVALVSGESSELAKKIAALAEPERSALALFYLNILPAREIASLLRFSLEDLSAALARARDKLRGEKLPNEKALETAS